LKIVSMRASMRDCYVCVRARARAMCACVCISNFAFDQLPIREFMAWLLISIKDAPLIPHRRFHFSVNNFLAK